MRNSRPLQILTIAVLILLTSCRTEDGAALGPMPISQDTAETVATGAAIDESCPGIGDIYELDEPGTYTAYALSRSGSLVTEVRGSHGEILAVTQPTAAAAEADLSSGAQFEIVAPLGLDGETGVMIHVERANSRYELVLVRFGGTEESDIVIRPPVEHVVRESSSCLIGDLGKTFKIQTKAVYSDGNTRQVFLIESPERLDHR